MNWNVYGQLAWTEHILSSPKSYEEEAITYVNVLQRNISTPNPTMLHLGCGAGGYDFHFKKHFLVTGVDISEGMLEIAKTTNPEITYIHGDMRNVKLNEKFDVVIIPDSIMYMITLEDLSAALKNAIAHMKPDGILLVVTHTKDEFQNNNFVYTGEDKNVHITLLENNHITSDSTYESSMIYLIRQDGELRIEHEVHTLGLFSYHQWMTLFEKLNLKVDEISLNHLYDKYLLDKGEYKLKIFVGTQIKGKEETQLDQYLEKASEYLKALCDIKPNRRTGSSGNREATDFFEETIRKHGYDIDATPFETMDYVCHHTSLTHGDKNYEVYASPYSLGCDISVEIITVSTVEELENSNCEGKILLMRGEICEEQLSPKNFVFYNPDHHKHIIELLENHKPAAIITATDKNPDQIGALSPFPLFVDGDFDIPSVYCLNTVADKIQTVANKKLHLRIDADRIPSSSSNVKTSETSNNKFLFFTAI